MEGFLLEELIAFCNGRSNPISHFSAKLLLRATNYYDTRLIYSNHFPWVLLMRPTLTKILPSEHNHFIFINPALSDEATQQLIDKICRQIEDYEFCYDTFNQNPKGPTADIVALTQITIEQANTNATNTHSFITQLLENTNDPAEKNALTTCENAYHLVMGCFSNAVVAFFQKDYSSMLQSEKPAPRAQASCMDIFNNQILLTLLGIRIGKWGS
ncbi:hypothetical protein CRYUN_Cryun09bG0181300 [Craigia yunnanensis]